MLPMALLIAQIFSIHFVVRWEHSCYPDHRLSYFRVCQLLSRKCFWVSLDLDWERLGASVCLLGEDLGASQAGHLYPLKARLLF